VKLGGAARLVSRGDALWFRAPALAFHSDVEHGVTHASLGNFSLTQAPDPRAVEERRTRLLEAAGLADAAVFAPPLHHSANVGRVAGGRIVDVNGQASGGRWDALVSDEPGTVLAVTVADCVPVFFVDVVEIAFGVAHAGWRGIFGGIVKRTVAAMIAEFGTKPGNLLVGTGPAIRGPSYEVGPEVAGLFPEPFTVPVGDPTTGRCRRARSPTRRRPACRRTTSSTSRRARTRTRATSSRIVAATGSGTGPSSEGRASLGRCGR
jgi:copper oxidase (laccase) domain-containing protein